MSAVLAPSLAVLPLANASGDPDKEYFAEGLTEYLHAALVGVRALRVASRGAAASQQGRLSLAELGRTLDAAAVLDGSVTRLGGQLRLNARLRAAADGAELWSVQVDEKLEDVFPVLRGLAERILETLRVSPTPEERHALDHVPTRNLRALDPYLRARRMAGEVRRTSQDSAVLLFGDATQADPAFALAHAGLAEAHAMLFTYWVSSDENLRAADAASARGVELGSMLAETHLARGMALSLNRRHDAAEEEFLTALALKPNLFEAHYHFARHCRSVGRLAESARWFESAGALRPEDYATPALLSSVYVSLKQADQARASQRRSVELAERRLKQVPDDERALYLGAGCLSSLGEAGRAREWAKRAVAMEPDDSAVLYNVACVYALLGLSDSAIDCLERSVANGFGHWEWIEHDSDFDALREHPRFQTLLQQKK